MDWQASYFTLQGKENHRTKGKQFFKKFRTIISHLLKNECNGIHIIEIWVDGNKVSQINRLIDNQYNIWTLGKHSQMLTSLWSASILLWDLIKDCKTILSMFLTCQFFFPVSRESSQFYITILKLYNLILTVFKRQMRTTCNITTQRKVVIILLSTPSVFFC